MEGKRYFHELGDSEYAEVLASGMTWMEFVGRYEQPLWCGYHGALEGRMGCWSLFGLWGVKNRIRCERDCRTCDCYEPRRDCYGE